MADALALGASERKLVEVRVLSSAPVVKPMRGHVAQPKRSYSLVFEDGFTCHVTAQPFYATSTTINLCYTLSLCTMSTLLRTNRRKQNNIGYTMNLKQRLADHNH